MRLEVTGLNFSVTEPLLNHVERRVAAALGRFFDRVADVTVRLCRQGPSQKRCLVTVQLVRGPSVVIGDDEPDVYQAVDLATDRMHRVVARRLARRSRPHRRSARM